MDNLSSQKPTTEIIYETKLNGFSARHVIKLRIEDHTYMFFRNTWDSGGDTYLHDPGCQCLKEEK